MTARLVQKNGRFYGVICYKDEGKHKQKWKALGLPVKNNKRKAEEMLAQFKREWEEAYATPRGDMLLTTYIKRWLERKKSLVQRSTWLGYQAYAQRHVIPYFEPLQLSLRQVKPLHIKNYYEYKYTAGRMDGRPGGLSIISIKKHAVILKEALDDAVMEERIGRNPAVGVKLPAKALKVHDRPFLNLEEANELIAAFEGHPLQALVYTTLYYGLRRSEVIGLRWSAIDFERNTLTINHTVVQNYELIARDGTKNASSQHTYFLIEDVRRVLLQQKTLQDDWRACFGEAYQESDYVFTWPDGSIFSPGYVTEGFQCVLREKKMPAMRFHDLRHSTASILYDKGWDLKDIQSWLRHSDISVTADIYTHIGENRKFKMAQDLNHLLRIREKSRNKFVENS